MICFVTTLFEKSKSHLLIYLDMYKVYDSKKVKIQFKSTYYTLSYLHQINAHIANDSVLNHQYNPIWTPVLPICFLVGWIEVGIRNARC